MQTKSLPVIPTVVLFAATLACTLTGTIPPLTPEPSPEPTPQVNVDVTITTPPLNAVLPASLASSATTTLTTEVEYPYINPSFGEMPAHTKYGLENYLLVGSILQPQVTVFKADEYGAYSDLNQQTITGLKAYDPNSAGVLPEGLPEGMISAQIRSISFHNGHGLRYLTQPGQAATPIYNSSLFYFFQGITDDGSYFVSAILPTSASYLVANDNPTSPLPVNGIPFEFDNYDALPSYIEAVKQKLDSSSANEFTPSLETLDSFIQSFLIQAS
ncbi:MAG: hypothetical protein A2Y54_00360 [Chloroflexi bacterium RBG_16_51_16]|nr:MAG: hypothetical protein A2Y54_00360 [Chloroflexi bacterium RBG_16_51_16]